MPLTPNVHHPKCPSPQMSLTPKCPSPQMSLTPNVPHPECPSPQNVPHPKCPSPQNVPRPKSHVISTKLVLNACVSKLVKSYVPVIIFELKLNQST